MNQISYIFKNTILRVTIIFISMAFVFSFYIQELSNTTLYKRNHFYLFFFLFLLILCIFITQIFSHIDSIKEERAKKIQLVLWVIILSLQAFILLFTNATQVTDSYMINDQALNIAKGIERHADFSGSYFSVYSNNNLMLTIMIYSYKILLKLGLIAFSNQIFAFFNILWINLSIFFVKKAISIMFDYKNATKFLLLSSMNPLNYLLIYWIYTLNLSLPFIGFTILSAAILFSKDEKYNKKVFSILFLVLIACVAAIGFLLRPIIDIPLFALLIVWILSKKNNIKIKSFFKIFLFLSILIFCYGSLNLSINHTIGKPTKDTSFPITHWIMMGLSESGEITTNDFYYTHSFSTKEEKQTANLEEIKRRILDRKITGNISHIARKISTTWSNGIGYYQQRIAIDNKITSPYLWIIGDKSDFVSIYCQAYHVLLLGLVLISIFQKTKRQSIYNFDFFIVLSLFGAILFYILWEAKAAYSIPFIPFLCLLATDVETRKVHILIKKRKNIFSVFIILFTIICFAFNYKPLTKNKITWKEPSLLTESNYFYIYRNYIGYVSSTNSTLKQNFYTSKPFNRIKISCKAISLNSTENYKIIVKRNKKIISNQLVGTKSINNTEHSITLHVPIQNSTKNTKYSIEISAKYPHTPDSIVWFYRLSKATNQYKGKGFISNKEIPDININLYTLKKGYYMSEFQFLILFSMICSLEMWCFFYKK
ncbi:MAG: hypothetical protein PHD70_13070 [Anaerostipes sp.]|nr:hypothetical protein [Anaerostipes sp.]MDD3747387.1 hypothetical protein [Anaerostipes sp.]